MPERKDKVERRTDAYHAEGTGDVQASVLRRSIRHFPYTKQTLSGVCFNVPLTETAINSKPCIVHREGAGVVTLRGLTNQCRALYKVTYGGNIAIPTGGAVGAITAALAVNGEALTSATATVTPATVENYFNIYVSAQVCVPKGCCLTVAMKNTSTQAVSFANSNLTVERIA